MPKTKGKKKKKRKRIIESDNQSENDEEDEPKIEEQCEPSLQGVDTTGLNEMLDIDKQENFENNTAENNVEIKDERLPEVASEVPIPQIPQQPQELLPVQKIKKVSLLRSSFLHTYIHGSSVACNQNFYVLETMINV